jgi:hypothetical protein
MLTIASVLEGRTVAPGYDCKFCWSMKILLFSEKGTFITPFPLCSACHREVQALLPFPSQSDTQGWCDKYFHKTTRRIS